MAWWLVPESDPPPACGRVKQARRIFRSGIGERVSGVDLLVTPGMPHEAPPLGVVQSNTRFTGPFNALGWPAMVVPVGLGEGDLPVAIQIAARPGLESLVFRAARVVERGGPWPVSFTHLTLPTSDLG